jgi:tRNA A-37 threonylcarbamoyl transferase component Bud32
MTSVGDYDLEHQIGAGAAGTVWKAHRRGPVARIVALKRLRAGSAAADLARMRREATVLTELDHPHVVRVLEVLHDGDGVAIAMQYAPGGSLADLLAERGRLPPGQVVAVAAPVADALASAHRRGVLHGDVKPANILFTSDGEPLLGDFGVARTLGLVTSDQISGTAEYMAPELVDGAQPDPRADVYSLAVVCYQALTGRPPYTGAVPLAVARAADAGVHERLEEVAGVPEPLARVVEQAMDRDPARRFAAADGMARALRATVPAGDVRVPGPATMGRVTAAADTGAGLTTTFGPRPPRPEPDTPGRRRWVPPALVLAGLVAAGGIAVLRGPLASDDAAADCPEDGSSAQSATAQVVRGDVDGDGCAVAGVYQPQALPSGSTGMVLTIPLDGTEKQIGLGEPGDRVVLGDWNCDGVDTPALYRRAAGEVQYFDVWPAVEQRSYQPDAVENAAVGGDADLEEGSGRDRDCDRVRVSTTGSDDTGAGAIPAESVSMAATPTGGPLSAIMGGAGDTTATPGEGRPAGPWEIRSSNRPPSRRVMHR